MQTTMPVLINSELILMNKFAVTLIAVALGKHTPTAVFHGLGDQCVNPGMHNFAKEIGDKTGAYSHCVEVGNGSETSFFGNFKKQA